MRKTLFYLLLHALLLNGITNQVFGSALDESSAVILMYHHVDRNTPKSTSVTPEVFKQHISYLSKNGFKIWPLSKVIKYIKTAKPLPAKTLVLTFDDAYHSVYSAAFPILKEKKWPFTVFVTPEYISNNSKNYMSWEQLQEIRQYGADIGNHGMTHPHLIRMQKDESQQQWYSRVVGEIEQAQKILNDKINDPIKVFAYPYGEYNAPLKKMLSDMDYAAVGQHSGAFGLQSDLQAIPRFPIATGFDDLESYALKVNSKPMSINVISPDDGIVDKDTKIPKLILELGKGNYNEHLINCYASGQGKIRLQWIDKDKKQIRVMANTSLSSGRTKYNCTAPSRTEKGIYYWFSFLWMKPGDDGQWYKE